jgi:hypothetical protein
MIDDESGRERIRYALRIRAKRGHLGPVARDLGVGLAGLEQFSTGGANLPDATLKALATELFSGHAAYDPVLDRLNLPRRRHPRNAWR